MFRQRSTVPNSAEFVLHEGFHQSAQHPRGNGVDFLTLEGANKKRGESFEGVWGNRVLTFGKTPPKQPLAVLFYQKFPYEKNTP